MRRAFTLIEFLFVLFGLLIVLFIGGIVTFDVFSSFHTESGQVFTIKDKAVVGKSGQYLIYTDKTTYEIDDTWLHGRWDSSDVYGKMEVGKTYICTLQGYRVPFFSMYPNILQPIEITTKTEKN